MRRLRVAIGIVLLGLAAAAAGTFLALEGGEVVVLRTERPEGGVRETRVWIAEQEGVLWLEAATPDRGWYRDLLLRPELELVRAGRARPYRAAPEPGPAGHERIRALLRAKYGLADWWVGLLQDTTGSIAVRLDP
jgi:hypothetical protein